MARAPRRDGARQAPRRLGGLARAWLSHHRLSAADSLRRLAGQPLATLMTTLVLGIALAMPVGLWVGLENARALSGEWDSGARLSLFLRPEVSLEAAAALGERVSAREEVAAVELVSREQALEEFRRLSGFDDALRNLRDNPLPNLLLVTPGPAASQGPAAGALRETLAALPGVDRAILDLEWVRRLNALVALGRRLVMVLGVVLAGAVLLVVGNTIRLAIENRRDEILVIKLVGGSDAFARRPFLYTGLWYGLTGSVVAWLVVNGALWALRGPLSNLAVLYPGRFALQGLGAGDSVLLLAAGAALGLAGAWFAAARHLGAVEPR